MNLLTALLDCRACVEHRDCGGGCTGLDSDEACAAFRPINNHSCNIDAETGDLTELNKQIPAAPPSVGTDEPATFLASPHQGVAALHFIPPQNHFVDAGKMAVEPIQRKYSPAERAIARNCRGFYERPRFALAAICAAVLVIGHAQMVSGATDGKGRNKVAPESPRAQPPRRTSMAIKLAVLQRAWNLGSRGSASRARGELIERAARLADRPHNQAEAIDSLVRRAGPLIERYGLEGLVKLLSDK